MDFNGIGTSYSAYETKNVSAKSTNDKKADSTDKSSEKSVYSEISASYEPSSSTSKVHLLQTERPSLHSSNLIQNKEWHRCSHL